MIDRRTYGQTVGQTATDDSDENSLSSGSETVKRVPGIRVLQIDFQIMIRNF